MPTTEEAEEQSDLEEERKEEGILTEFDAVVAVLSRILVIRFRVVDQYKVVSRIT